MKSAALLLALLLNSICAASDWDFTPRDRRDPFTFLRTVKVEDDKPPIPTVPTVDSVKLLTQAGELYEKAQTSMSECKTEDVIRLCGEGLKGLSVVPRYPLIWRVEEMRQQLVSLRKAGETLHQRLQAQKAFDEMALSVSGVVTRENMVHAIINGNVVKPGNTFKPNGEESLTVESISTVRVVLLFRGYKMATAFAQR